VGWKEDNIYGYHKSYPVIDTLYVLLKEPSYTVQIPGLPPNVVPISRTSSKIECELYSGLEETINQEQIDILPNLAMTDYASQGGTRPINVIDLT